MLLNCKYCNLSFDLMTSQQKANHSRWCVKNPTPKIASCKPFLGKHHTEENKKILSKKRKLWLKENPDKHPWKLNNKFKSAPCEKLKQILRNNNINFLDEDSIIEGRHYSADIYFPDKKVVLEVNGNQHYNRDKTLKPYYQERHDNFISNGWIVYEIPYTLIYNKEFIDNILNVLRFNYRLENIDYTKYIKFKKETYCVECGKIVNTKSVRCKKCSDILNGSKRRKFEITRDELEKLIKEKKLTEIGKMFNVSDNAVKKRMKKLKLI